METFLLDLRYAFRMLAKSPGFTAVAALTLALAIGANTAVFSAINALLLNPLPFPDSDRIVLLDARHISGNNNATGYLDYLDWRAQSDSFEEMAIQPWTGAYTWNGRGEQRRLIGGATTPGFLKVMGIQPIRGRFITPEEDVPGAPGVAVISYAEWQRDFAGKDDAIGQTISLDGRPFRIVGVMPRGFVFPGTRTCDFFTALRERAQLARTQHQYEVVARLKLGVNVAQAQANMTVIAKHLEQQYPLSNRGWGVAVLPLRQALAADSKTPLLILFSAALFVLLLACVNLAALLLARASSRAREMAIRSSIGAGRLRILRQLLTESAVLSLSGGAVGLFFAGWLMEILRHMAPEESGLDSALRLDWTVLVFTLLLSVATGIVFGMAPAWLASGTNLNTTLKGKISLWSGGRLRSRLQSALIIAQVGLSTALLIVAGLLTRDLFVVLQMNTGLHPENVLVFALDLPSIKYPTAQSKASLYRAVTADLRRVPAIEEVAAVGALPMTGDMTGGAFLVEGRAKASDWVDTMVQYNSVTPAYFRTMGIPLLRGRDFDERDMADATPVAIINDTLARQFFPNEDPIGRRFQDDYDNQWRTIVGVVGSIKNQQPMKAPVPGVYAPYPQKPWNTMWVVARSRGGLAQFGTVARDVTHVIDPDLMVLHLRAMKQVVAESMSQSQLLASFLAFFASFALALAAIGIYGILSCSVSRRSHEIGIRMALGAAPRDILKLVVGRGAMVTAIGLAIGLPVALSVSGILRTLLYGIGPRDELVLTAVPAMVIVVALAASYFPARRAARVDPNVALRYE